MKQILCIYKGLFSLEIILVNNLHYLGSQQSEALFCRSIVGMKRGTVRSLDILKYTLERKSVTQNWVYMFSYYRYMVILSLYSHNLRLHQCFQLHFTS